MNHIMPIVNHTIMMMKALKERIHTLVRRVWYRPPYRRYQKCASYIYLVGMRLHFMVRDIYIALYPRPHTTIWSVCNITIGGNGKTPCVMLLAECAKRKNIRVAILTRGYGRALRRSIHAREDARVRVTDTAREVGDEPLMMARLTDIPVYCVDDPVCFLAQYGHDYDVWVVDDLYTRLRHWAQLWWVVSAIDGLGNGLLLPWGPMRFPASYQESPIKSYSRSETEESFYPVLLGLRSLDSSRYYTPEDWPFMHAVFISGLAQPERVLAFLEDNIPCVLHPVYYADHQAFDAHDVESFSCVIVTEKDAARMDCNAPHVFVMDVVYVANNLLSERIEDALSKLLCGLGDG